MEANYHAHRSFQHSFFKTARMVFKDEDALANTMRAEDLDDLAPNTLRSNQVLAVREAITETLEQKVKRLEEENEALKKRNMELEKISMTDELTQLHTRSYFDDKMLQTVDEAIRYGKDFSLMFVDLDNFKLLNDKMGHQAGDEALKMVGKIIHETLRPSDVKCRYGGEELVIILPEIDKNEAHIAAERLRKAIANKLKPHLREQYGDSANAQMCTASIGVTSYLDGEERDEKDQAKVIKALIKEADFSMYQAKKSGRNQVSVYHKKTPSKRTVRTVLKTATEDPEIRRLAEELMRLIEKTIPKGMVKETLDEIIKKIKKEDEEKP